MDEQHYTTTFRVPILCIYIVAESRETIEEIWNLVLSTKTLKISGTKAKTAQKRSNCQDYR